MKEINLFTQVLYTLQSVSTRDEPKEKANIKGSLNKKGKEDKDLFRDKERYPSTKIDCMFVWTLHVTIVGIMFSDCSKLVLYRVEFPDVKGNALYCKFTIHEISLISQCV